MNELDLFMERLIYKENCFLIRYKEVQKSAAGKDYIKIVSKFKVRNIMTFIKTCDMADAIRFV